MVDMQHLLHLCASHNEEAAIFAKQGARWNGVVIDNEAPFLLEDHSCYCILAPSLFT